MPVQDSLTAAVVTGGTKLDLAKFIQVTGAANPAFLVVSALDRNEYTPLSSGATGLFAAGGTSLALTEAGGDARTAGIVYSWQGGQYVNAQFGALSALTYISSGSAADVTSISLFTTGSLALATQDAADPVALLLADPGGYDGSLTVVTNAHPSTTTAAPATPDRVAACAQSFVGQAWNDEGCWLLASTIAAEAGAGLPVQSTAIGVPGRPNGNWIVVYNGPAHAAAGWQSLVRTGDVITFATPGGGGHVTTCVSGQGGSAMLIDNVTYQDSTGGIVNGAHDGSASDVLVAAAHPASQEWAGVQAAGVVIYALDTPWVTARVPVAAISKGVLGTLAGMAAVSDPGGRGIVQVQAYDVGGSAALLLHGAAVAASAAHPLTASGLAAIGVEGLAAGTDTIEVRACNGTSWGDWAPVVLQVGGGTGLAGGTVAAVGSEGHPDWITVHAGLAGMLSAYAGLP